MRSKSLGVEMTDIEMILLMAVAVLALIGAIVMAISLMRSGGASKKQTEESSRGYLNIETVNEDGDEAEESSEEIEDEEDEESEEDELDEEDLLDEDGPALEAFEAKVIAKKMESLVNGTNVSMRAVEFILIFETSEGEKKSFIVDRKRFDSVNEGDEGTLVLLGGEIFDFGEGEEIVEETAETEAE